MRTEKEIVNYLSKKRWYKEYLYNVIELNKDESADFINGLKQDETISEAFEWDKTNEGFDVWNDRNSLFTEWYNKTFKWYAACIICNIVIILLSCVLAAFPFVLEYIFGGTSETMLLSMYIGSAAAIYYMIKS